MRPVVPALNDREAQYLVSINRALALAALGAMVIAVLLGAVLARTLTQPVRDLTHAIDAMSRGELRQEVPVRSADELGTLTLVFNRMSADLARSNELRREMTADIAHDLRTPLTVITGYIEALRDGVLKPTPARFETMHNEAQQLKRLVEDLRTLSLVDAGELPMQRQRVAPRALLDRLAAAYVPQAAARQITLAVSAASEAPDILVDPERMAQVLGNLVTNALRHTPAGGRIDLSRRRRGRAWPGGGGYRGRHSGGCAAACLRPLLPRGRGAQPAGRRVGPGAGHRQVHRRSARRDDRRGKHARTRDDVHRHAARRRCVTDARWRRQRSSTRRISNE